MSFAFISYARNDAQFVDRLSSDLLSRGVDVWVDRNMLAGGVDWSSTVETAINQASVILVVVSKSSVTSQWTDLELHYSTKLRKLIIPLVIENVTDIPLLLVTMTNVSFTGDYRKGLDRLLEVLPEDVRKPDLVERKSPKSKGYFFISYAEEDSPFVETMRSFLEQRNYGFWDYQESERDYNTQMFLELERQIGQATAVLCILSPDWKISKWAPKEYLFAEELVIPTFLLMARTMGPTLVTAGVTYIDFVRDIRKGFEKLDKEFRRKKLI